jgi:hypothetical protein
MIDRSLQSVVDCMLVCVWEHAAPAADRISRSDVTSAAVDKFRACMVASAFDAAGLQQAAGGVAAIAGWIDDEGKAAIVDSTLRRVTMSEKVVGHRFAARWRECLETVGTRAAARVSGSSEQAKIVQWDALKHEVLLHLLKGTSATVSGFVSHSRSCVYHDCDSCLL